MIVGISLVYGRSLRMMDFILCNCPASSHHKSFTPIISLFLSASCPLLYLPQQPRVDFVQPCLSLPISTLSQAAANKQHQASTNRTWSPWPDKAQVPSQDTSIASLDGPDSQR
ncbi:hypothetical protein VTL71DRAFT_3146 [Oculimacula yallundae]|uniref:Uncharacterized protein n=1 Tax=Oculimacula yallundae TaxID=86028 RepID=A0ABR4C853_9HELO